MKKEIKIKISADSYISTDELIKALQNCNKNGSDFISNNREIIINYEKECDDYLDTIAGKYYNINEIFNGINKHNNKEEYSLKISKFLLNDNEFNILINKNHISISEIVDIISEELKISNKYLDYIGGFCIIYLPDTCYSGEYLLSLINYIDRKWDGSIKMFNEPMMNFEVIDKKFTDIKLEKKYYELRELKDIIASEIGIKNITKYAAAMMNKQLMVEVEINKKYIIDMLNIIDTYIDDAEYSLDHILIAIEDILSAGVKSVFIEKDIWLKKPDCIIRLDDSKEKSFKELIKIVCSNDIGKSKVESILKNYGFTLDEILNNTEIR